MSFRAKILLLIALTAVTITGALFAPPIPQDPAYHRFADGRACFAVANCGDVLSNIAFAIAGVLGLAVLFGGARGRSPDILPYFIFFAAVLSVSVGSAYYHWRPDNARLFWDRLPMTVGFMAFASAIVVDRIDRRAGLRVVLPVLLALGVASIVYWAWTEAAGRGDLRFYALVQFLPPVLIPLVCWMFPDARHTHGRHIAWIYVWYGLAKLLELGDLQVFDALGGVVSGHTLKHLAAALATACVIPMAMAARRARLPSHPARPGGGGSPATASRRLPAP